MATIIDKVIIKVQKKTCILDANIKLKLVCETNAYTISTTILILALLTSKLQWAVVLLLQALVQMSFLTKRLRIVEWIKISQKIE